MLSVLALGTLALFASSEASATPGPVLVTLQSRKTPKGSVSSLRRRALSSIGVPLEDWFLGTDLQWYGNISVGTPPQNVSVVFDTGSETLEFAIVDCASCTQAGKFDTSKSSTFVVGTEVTTLEFATGNGVLPVEEGVYTLTMQGATDTVTVGGFTAPNVSFYAIVDQTPAFDVDPFIGIQGMSSQAEGFFQALTDAGLPSLFSLYLTPQADGNAELLLGGIDDTKFQGDLVYTTQYLFGEWMSYVNRISVNGQSNATLSEHRAVIFDSGTSNIILPTDATEAIYAFISTDIQPFADEPGAYGLPCDQVAGLPAVIDITLSAQDGTPFNLTIPSSELSVGPFPSNTTVCQMLINAYDGINIVGASMLKHYYSVWDIGNQRIGFAPNGL